MNDVTTHPSDEAFEMFVRGDDEGIDFVDFEAHVASCPSCALRLERESAHEVRLEQLAERITFCPGCDRVVRDPRCDYCGVAVAPGGYVVERVLVQTAHGRVYVARDARGEAVALKELVFMQVPDLQTLTGFEREAKLLAQLDHPGIPRCIGSFVEGEGVHTRLYLAQEYVPGESLSERLTKHRFDERELVRIAEEVLEILAYLQSVTPPIFHRDVKPANLVMREDGAILLVDFGAARDLGATGGASLVGTFGYIPQEQLVGIVDATSDLFGLGATIVHLATRRPPWAQSDRARLLENATLSVSFARFVRRLVAEDRAARFANAIEARAALANRRASPRRSMRWAWLLAAATLGLAASWVAIRPNRGPVPARNVVPTRPWRPTKPTIPEGRRSSLGRESVLVSTGRGVVSVGGVSAADPGVASEVMLRAENGQWRVATHLNEARRTGYTVTRLDDESLLVVGGEADQGAEICTSRACRTVARPAFSRFRHAAVALDDDSVLVAGGATSPTTAERYLVKEDRWVRVADLPVPSESLALVVSGAGVVGYGMRDGFGHTLTWDATKDVWGTRSLGRISSAATTTWAAMGRAVTFSGAPRWWGADGEIVDFEPPALPSSDAVLFDHPEFGPLAVTSEVAFLTYPAEPVPVGRHVLRDRAIAVAWERALVIGGIGEQDQYVPLPRHAPTTWRPAPDRAQAKIMLEAGKQALIKGRLESARTSLEKCLKADPYLADCHRNLGVLFAKSDDVERALRHYRRYVELAPQAKDANRVRQMIQSAVSD